MAEALFVLWIYYLSSWSWLGIPMTPGWSAEAVLEKDNCKKAVVRLLSIDKASICLPAGIILTPIAQFEEVSH